MPCETCRNFHCSYWIRPEPKERLSISKPNSYYSRTITVIMILSFIDKGDKYCYFHVYSVFQFWFQSSKYELFMIITVLFSRPGSCQEKLNNFLTYWLITWSVTITCKYSWVGVEGALYLSKHTLTEKFNRNPYPMLLISFSTQQLHVNTEVETTLQE